MARCVVSIEIGIHTHMNNFWSEMTTEMRKKSGAKNKLYFEMEGQKWDSPFLNSVDSCAAVHKLWFSDRTTTLSLAA